MAKQDHKENDRGPRDPPGISKKGMIVGALGIPRDSKKGLIGTLEIPIQSLYSIAGFRLR